jgi:hypothetical protein
MGEETIQHHRSYALEAERKIGEMLAKTVRSRGTDKAGHTKPHADRALPSDPPPTLAKLGVTRRGSAASHLPETIAATRPRLAQDPSPIVSVIF